MLRNSGGLADEVVGEKEKKFCVIGGMIDKHEISADALRLQDDIE